MADPRDRPASAGTEETTLKPERVQEEATAPGGTPKPEQGRKKPAEPPGGALKPERVQ